MIDKQIIIHSVDVSGCELYRDDNGVFAPDGTAERTELCYLTNDYCTNNPNCYYKQLKAKEQECEELKETLKVIANRPCLNINDCNGNCLPHCKWNAHKLAQEALKELE